MPKMRDSRLDRRDGGGTADRVGVDGVEKGEDNGVLDRPPAKRFRGELRMRAKLIGGPRVAASGVMVTGTDSSTVISTSRWRRIEISGAHYHGAGSLQRGGDNGSYNRNRPPRRRSAVSATLLDKREPRIRRMFGSIAPVYDLLNHLLSLNVDRWWRWRTTRLAPPVAEGPILDVCTGTGDLALAYDRAAGRRLSIFATDFCLPMLEPALRKTRRRSAAERVHYAEADTQRLPFPANTFQLTTVGFGLRNVTDVDRGIAEMVRVTRPGGRVAILEFSRPRGWFFGPLYRFYFRRVLPFIGQLISHSKDSAYSYLPASVLAFPDGAELAAKLRAHGLVEVGWHPLTFGIATVYIGTKVSGPPA
jgi:demethylmenaquinone methyltransferase/2-methoxy-6-polyprenyl-1,4-benzoquinol methylase